MDIQRGDQVYYRGEVWTVQAEFFPKDGEDWVELIRAFSPSFDTITQALVKDLQRVEQVR